MCARFTLTLPDYAALARALGVEILGDAMHPYRPRYNAAPAEAHLILRAHEGKRELTEARWGFIPRWAKDPTIGHKLVNARAETAPDKPTFRDAFAKRRCVLPADGFYEWGGPKGARQPYWFHPPEGGLLYIGALYETWKNPATGEGERTFTVLTTPANEVVGAVHDRMPVLLAAGDVGMWLGADAPSELAALRARLVPAKASTLVSRRVSTRVNAVTAEGPSLLEEVSAEEAARKAPAKGSRARREAPPSAPSASVDSPEAPGEAPRATAEAAAEAPKATAEAPAEKPAAAEAPVEAPKAAAKAQRATRGRARKGDGIGETLPLFKLD